MKTVGKSAALSLLLVVAAACGGGREAPPQIASAIEPRADDLLRKMCSLVRSAQTIHLTTSETNDRIKPDGEKVQVAFSRDLTIRRPDGLRGTFKGGGMQAEIWYDGKTLSIQGDNRRMWAQAEVPPTLDQMLDFVNDRIDLRMPLADLFYEDSYAAYAGPKTTGRYVGLEEIAGVRAHHLSFQDEAVDFDIWVQDGDRPLPRKLDLVYKLDDGAPKYSIVFDTFDIAPQVTADLFTFKPAEGYTRVRFAGQKLAKTGS
jgi:hypothetical protein